MSVHRVVRGGKARYEVRWREQGRQASRLFDRRRDAHAYEAELRRRRQLGPMAVQQLTARDGPTLDEWIEHHWVPEHASTLAQSTRERYANVYACHIADRLGDLRITELSVARLREWQAALLQDGTSPGTIHKCRTFLSSVLRHAAESEAIPGNPLSLVRAPKSFHREAVQPLSPAAVETIRRALLDPPPREVGPSGPGQRSRRGYELAAPGNPDTRQRDAVIVSLLAYAGLRPGELRGLRFGDIGERTILVQRAANPDGSVKPTKTDQRRSVRLLEPLADDLREYHVADGRPHDSTLLLRATEGRAWDKSAWQMWRADRWLPACRAASLDPAPRPYDLRHGFVSLLLAEGRQPVWVARQAGHSLAVLLSTYAHLIDEYAERDQVDPEQEIRRAREQMCSSYVR